MPSNPVILCPLLLPPSIFPSVRVFSNESALHIKWPKNWSFSFSISSSDIQGWFPLGLTGFPVPSAPHCLDSSPPYHLLMFFVSLISFPSQLRYHSFWVAFLEVFIWVKFSTLHLSLLNKLTIQAYSTMDLSFTSSPRITFYLHNCWSLFISLAVSLLKKVGTTSVLFGRL